MATKKKGFSNAEFKVRLVNQLEADLMDFRGVCLQIPEDAVDPTLKAAIFELGIGVIHFIDQYRMIATSIVDLNKLPGRAKKHEERDYFRQEVTKHQIKFPNKFPTWDAFSKGLDALNIKRLAQKRPELVVESRAYDKWKKLWKNKEFDKLVHD
jgi:hypothetical protein